MEFAFKLAAIGVICTTASLILRQYKSEYALFLELAGICVITFFAINSAHDVIASIKPMLEFTNIGEQTAEILIKALAIATFTAIAADICRDNSNQALASVLEFFGKAAVIVLCVPLLKAVAEIAAGFINS